MKITKEHLLILFWLAIGTALLFHVSPGDVEMPYAQY